MSRARIPRDPGGLCGRHADPGPLDRRLHPGLPAAGGGRPLLGRLLLAGALSGGKRGRPTIVVYLLVFSTPFNAMLAILNGGGRAKPKWLLVAASGVLSALAQMSIARAYSVAEASFVQPFDFAKLPMNVLAGWLVFGWRPRSLVAGAPSSSAPSPLLTHLEQRATHPLPEVRHACLFLLTRISPADHRPQERSDVWNRHPPHCDPRPAAGIRRTRQGGRHRGCSGSVSR